VGKPEGKRPLGRPRRRWEDGIRMDLREIGLGGVAWIRLSQDRDRWQSVVSAVMNLRVLAPRSCVMLCYVMFDCFCFNRGFGLSVTFFPLIIPNNQELPLFIKSH
jgi:hypothetical protein